MTLWGSQKIVILGVCYKTGVSISKFASLENGGGEIYQQMGAVKKSRQNHRKILSFHLFFDGC